MTTSRSTIPRDETERSLPFDAFWIPVGSEGCVGWLHAPPGGRVRTSTVVVCPPFGHEYAHTHRSLVHLATTLAEAGFLVLRIDYPGTGDSSGTESTSGLFELCLEAIDEGARTLERLTGGAPVTLVGLRLGAGLAARLASRREIRHLVAWIPTVEGKRYLRELDALRAFSGTPAPKPDGYSDVGGFRMSPETVAAVKALDLLKGEYRIGGEALVVERGDLGSDGRLAAHFRAQDIPVEEIQQPDYPSMVAEPQYTVVPEATIRAMTEWLAAREDGPRVEVDEAARDGLVRTRAFAFDGVREELVTVPSPGCPGLFGVLCTPASADGGEGSVVLLPNSGSVHHIGPNRLYVELARDLARSGTASLRFDLRNLGDSRVGRPPDENHPYPATAVQDVGAAVAWATGQRGYDGAVIAGLCSGAYTAFRSGVELDSDSIRGVVSVNPLTFHWRDGMSLDTPDSHRNARDATYYGQALRDWARWLRLLRGQSNIRYILRFMTVRLLRHARNTVSHTLGFLRLRKQRPIERDLRSIEDAGRRIHFVFSKNDPGREILLTEARPVVRGLLRRSAMALTLIPGADHTFSYKPWREAAIADILRHVKSINGYAGPR